MERSYAEYILKKTKDDYNLIAEDFSRVRSRMWEEMRFLVDDYVMTGEKILDLGCGNGRFFGFLSNKKIDYIGIDNSEKLVEIAKKRYPEARFQVADVLNLPFSKNFFDKIYSIAVLHHIPSEEFRLQFLRETKRVLKAEGLLILTVWKFHESKALYLILKYAILKLFRKSRLDWKDIFEPWGKKIDRYYHCFSKKELIKLGKKSGFRIKESDIVRNERGNRQNIYLIAQK